MKKLALLIVSFVFVFSLSAVFATEEENTLLIAPAPEASEVLSGEEMTIMENTEEAILSGEKTLEEAVTSGEEATTIGSTTEPTTSETAPTVTATEDSANTSSSSNNGSVIGAIIAVVIVIAVVAIAAILRKD